MIFTSAFIETLDTLTAYLKLIERHTNPRVYMTLLLSVQELVNVSELSEKQKKILSDVVKEAEWLKTEEL